MNSLFDSINILKSINSEQSKIIQKMRHKERLYENEYNKLKVLLQNFEQSISAELDSTESKIEGISREVDRLEMLATRLVFVRKKIDGA